MDDLVFICVSCGKGLSDYEEFCSHVASHDSGAEVQDSSTNEPVKDSFETQTEKQSLHVNGKKGGDKDENLKCTTSTKSFDIRDVEQTCNEILEVAAARKGEHVTSGCTNADFITQSERQTLQEASKLILLSKLQSEAKLHHAGDRVSRPVFPNGTADLPKPSNREKEAPRHTRYHASNSSSKTGMDSDLLFSYKPDSSKMLTSNGKYGNTIEVFPKRSGLTSSHCREYSSKEEGSFKATNEVVTAKTEPFPDWSGSRYWSKRYKEGHGLVDKDRGRIYERGHADSTFYGYHSPPGHLVPIHIPIHQPHVEIQAGKAPLMTASEVHDAKGIKAIPHKLHTPCSRNSSVTVPLCRSPKSLPFISDVRSLSHIVGDDPEERSCSASPKSTAVFSSSKVDHILTSEQNRPYIILERNQVFEDQPAKTDRQGRKPGTLEKAVCHRDSHSKIDEHNRTDKVEHCHVTSYIHPRHHTVHSSSKHTHADYSKPEVRMSHTYSYYPLKPGHAPLHGIPQHVPHYRFNTHYKSGQYSTQHYSPLVHIGDISDNSRGHETGLEIPNLAAAKSRESCNCAQCFRRTHPRGSAHYLHSPTSIPLQELKKMTQNEATQTSSSPCECDEKVQSRGPKEQGDGRCCNSGKACNVRSTCTHETLPNRTDPSETSLRHTGHDHCHVEDGREIKIVQESCAHGKRSCHDATGTLPVSCKSCKVDVDNNSKSYTTATNGDTNDEPVSDALLPHTHSQTELDTNQTQHNLGDEQTASQNREENSNGGTEAPTNIRPVTVKIEPLEYTEKIGSRVEPITSQESLVVLNSVKKEEDAKKCEHYSEDASMDVKEESDVHCKVLQVSTISDVPTACSGSNEWPASVSDSMETVTHAPKTSESEFIEASIPSTVNSSEAVAEVGEEFSEEIESCYQSNDDMLTVSQDSTSDSCGSNWETLLCNEGTVPLSPSRTRSFVTNCTASFSSVYVDHRGRPYANNQIGWKDISQDGALKKSGLFRIFKMKDAEISAANESVASSTRLYVSGIRSNEDNAKQRKFHSVFRDSNENEVVVMSIKPGARGENTGYNNAGFSSLSSLELSEAQKSKVVEEVLLKQGKFVKGQTYECDICSRSYASYDEMFVHRQSHRQKAQDTQVSATKKVPRALCPRYIVCKFCDKTFQTSSDYGNHVAFECQRVCKKPTVTEDVSQLSDSQARSNPLVSSANENSSSIQATVTSNTCRREMRISVAGEEKLVSVVHPLLPSFPVTGAAKDSLTPSARGPVGGGEVKARQHGGPNSATSETEELNKSAHNVKDCDETSQTKDFLEKNPVFSMEKTAPVVVGSVTEQVSTNTDQHPALATKAALQTIRSGPPLTNLVVGNNVIQGQLIVTSTGTYLLPTQNVVFPQKNVSGKASLGYRPLLPKSINESNVEKSPGSGSVLPPVNDTTQQNDPDKTSEGISSRKRATKRKSSGDEEFYGPISTDATPFKKSMQDELSCSRCQTKFLDKNTYKLHLDKCGNSSRYNFRGRKTSYREFYESDGSISDD